MSEPYTGEIRMFCGEFAPRGWHDCDGAELEIREWRTLFEVLGARFGGDGQNTFRLPDLRGRVPVHQGRATDLLEDYAFASSGGSEAVPLAQYQVPQHTHHLSASTEAGTSANASGNMLAASAGTQLYAQDEPSAGMAAQAISNVGHGQAHENRMPFIAVRYIIATSGIFPAH
jgi:microcystin-dependent protein